MNAASLTVLRPGAKGAWLVDSHGISWSACSLARSRLSIERDASKVALVHLVDRLRAGGYALLDAQFLTEHLRTLGAVEIPKAEYRLRLEHALERREISDGSTVTPGPARRRKHPATHHKPGARRD